MTIDTKFNMGDMVCNKNHKSIIGKVSGIHVYDDGCVGYTYRIGTDEYYNSENELELAKITKVTKDEAFDAAIEYMRQYKDEKFESIRIYDLPLDKTYNVVVSSAVGNVIRFKYE